jgi:predicted GNAT superfamily acetyltransferase
MSERGGDQVVIRPAAAADFPGILEVNRQGRPGVSPIAPGDLGTILRRASFLRVAEAGSRVAGYLIGYLSSDDYDGEEFLWFRGRFDSFLYIDQVAVAEGARASGVGSLLYRDVEEFARARAVARLTCEVNLRPHNAVSLRFHERQGYRPVGELETRDGRLVSLLVRELPAA